MGYNKKTPKGEISIDNHKGRIRLRWRYRGRRYSLNLPFQYSPENLHQATLKATEIKLDILKGAFDSSLEKYRDGQPIESIHRSKIKEVKTAITEPHDLHLSGNIFLHTLSDQFSHWTKYIKNIEIDNSVDYLYVRKALEKWKNIPLDKAAEQLGSENWAVTTYNRRLHYLNDFFSWLKQGEKISFNPLSGISRRKEKGKKKNLRRKPLSEVEIFIFLEAIKNDSFCSTFSRFKHSHYYPFLYFMFSTGVRNAEAIGLKVKHVDLGNKQVEISETFARTTRGTNHAARIQKGTKMDNIRYLPLTDELVSLLGEQIAGKAPHDFVFPSATGLSIDDKMLQRRVLKPILKRLEFGDRDLYVARHSFGTRAAQQGITVTDIAYLMGHSNIETAMRNYIHTEKAALKLPTINSQINID